MHLVMLLKCTVKMDNVTLCAFYLKTQYSFLIIEISRATGPSCAQGCTGNVCEPGVHQVVTLRCSSVLQTGHHFICTNICGLAEMQRVACLRPLGTCPNFCQVVVGFPSQTWSLVGWLVVRDFYIMASLGPVIVSMDKSSGSGTNWKSKLQGLPKGDPFQRVMWSRKIHPACGRHLLMTNHMKVQGKGHGWKMLRLSACLPPVSLASSTNLSLQHFFANIRKSFYSLLT